MNSLNRRLVSAVCSLLLFAACQTEDPVAPKQENPLSTKGIYVLNEGGFTRSNASLSLVVPDSQKVYSDVFAAANGRMIGDVANDMVLYGSKAYIVVNNSHRIEVISTENHAVLGTLSLPGNSPFKTVITSAGKGYVTNLYKGTVTVYQSSTLEVLKSDIPVGMNPQAMAVAQGRVFVCNSGYGEDSTISVIDILTDSVIATISVPRGPSDIALDSDGELVVLSTGSYNFTDPSKDRPGAVTFIDPSAMSVIKTLPLPLAQYGHPSELAVSGKGYGYTFVQQGALKIDTKNHTLAASVTIPRSGYSIAVDDVTEKIYVGDAGNFSTNGKLYGYDKTGVLKDSATVGIIPGTILFKR